MSGVKKQVIRYKYKMRTICSKNPFPRIYLKVRVILFISRFLITLYPCDMFRDIVKMCKLLKDDFVMQTLNLKHKFFTVHTICIAAF